MAELVVAYGGTPAQWAAESPRMVATVIDVARERAEAESGN